MSELNRLIQRIRCDITNVKKQVGSAPQRMLRLSFLSVMETLGPALKKKQVPSPGLSSPWDIHCPSLPPCLGSLSSGLGRFEPIL